MLAKGRKGIPYLMVFLGLTLICGRAPAQTGITGGISGTVTDSSGAVVPGASVPVTSETTGAARTGESGSNGEFVFTALPPGTYTVRAEKAGFQGVYSAEFAGPGEPYEGIQKVFDQLVKYL